MHPEGIKPFTDSLKNPFTIIWLALGCILVVDLFTGNHLIGWAVGQQVRMMGHNPAVDTMRMMTVFGTFTSVAVWTAFVQKFLIVGAFVLGGLPMVHGLWVSVVGK
jgi:hypothetical protein